MHRLLSLDPRSRGPRLWELIKSVPDAPATADASEHMKDRASRKELVKKQLDLRLMMGMTTMEQFHEIGHDLQEECLFGLCDDFFLRGLLCRAEPGGAFVRLPGSVRLLPLRRLLLFGGRHRGEDLGSRGSEEGGGPAGRRERAGADQGVWHPTDGYWTRCRR